MINFDRAQNGTSEMLISNIPHPISRCGKIGLVTELCFTHDKVSKHVISLRRFLRTCYYHTISKPSCISCDAKLMGSQSAYRFNLTSTHHLSKVYPRRSVIWSSHSQLLPCNPYGHNSLPTKGTRELELCLIPTCAAHTEPLCIHIFTCSEPIYSGE